MLTADARLRTKDEEVIAKMMDGEAVIINLDNGMYYSSDGVGAVIWETVLEGHSLEQIAAQIVARYEVERDRAEADVLRFAEELMQHDLVAIAEADSDAPPPGAPDVDGRLPYRTPELHAYSDMEDLLALDPPTPTLAEIPWKG